MPVNRVKTRAGMFSRNYALRGVDGRTTDAKVIRDLIADLTEHLGGEARVSAPQKIIVHSAALLAYRLRAAVERYGTGTDIESLDRHVVTVQQALLRTLCVLGLDPAKSQPRSLAEYLRIRAVKHEKAKPAMLALVAEQAVDVGADVGAA